MTPTTLAPAERPSFPGLDSLRAIASLAVVVTHCAFWAGAYNDGLPGAALHRLEIGVPIFFVLSGFLLGYPFLHHHRSDTERPGLLRYAVLRVARIWPVYIVTVIAALSLAPQRFTVTVWTWVDNLLLVAHYRDADLPEGLTQMWSLSVEVAFYAALPLLAWLLRRAVQPWQPVRVLTLLALLAATGPAWLLAGGSTKALPTYLPWFAVGLALAVFHLEWQAGSAFGRGRLSTILRTVAAMPGTCWLLAGAVFVVACTPLTGEASLAERTLSENVLRLVLYALVAALVILPSVLGPTDSPYARALARPWLRGFGHRSYALFCVHVLLLDLVTRAANLTVFDTPFMPLLGLILAISLLITEVLYRGVERPAMSWARAFLRRSEASASAATSTPAAASAGS